MKASTLALFRNKRVLITGDTGFKGSWLALWLHQLGAHVTGYALPPEKSDSLFTQLELSNHIHHIDGDIRDLNALNKVAQRVKPEFLFHLAAQPLVRLSYKQPKETFDTNVGGSVNVLEAVRNTASLRSVIYVTSDKCYLNREWLWGYRENDELGGADPYSASKAAAEIVFAAYQKSFFNARGLGTASVRAGNVIGGGDWSDDRIVPDCIRALKNKKTILLRHPHAVRPWQHVLEPLSGYLMLAAQLYYKPTLFSGAWNFGPAQESTKTVEQLAREIVRLWGWGNVQTAREKKAPHEATLLSLHCEKAHSQLAWSPRWNFKQTVSHTVHWYKAVAGKIPAYAVSSGQIKEYMESPL